MKRYYHNPPTIKELLSKRLFDKLSMAQLYQKDIPNWAEGYFHLVFKYHITNSVQVTYAQDEMDYYLIKL
jgi:hypothetical protein